MADLYAMSEAEAERRIREEIEAENRETQARLDRRREVTPRAEGA
jgi:hypothetical protein